MATNGEAYAAYSEVQLPEDIVNETTRLQSTKRPLSIDKNFTSCSNNNNIQPQMTLTPYLVFSILSAVLGTSFMYGYASGVVNAPYAIITRFINQSSIAEDNRAFNVEDLNTEWSLFVSLFAIGGAVGSFWFPGAEVIRYGRSHALYYNAAIGAMGGFLSFISKYVDSYYPLMIGRAAVGFHAGLSMVIVPSLLVELAPLRLRGMCGSFNEFCILSGITFADIVSLPYLLGTNKLWNILFIIPSVAYVAHAVLMYFAAESPRWLVDQNKDEECLKTLKRLRNCDDATVQAEFDELKRLSIANSTLKPVSLLDFFRHRKLWWPLIICINLHCLQQFSGVAAIQFYANQVMIEAGLSVKAATLGNLGASAVNIIGNLVTMMIVDRVGRRILLLIGTSGMIVSLIFLTIVLNFNALPASIAAFALFLTAFSLGPGPIPWFLTAEMFTQNARPMALSICTVINWLTGLLVSFMFPYFQLHIPHYAFVPFACWSLYALIFVFLFLPDTSGITSEKIAELFLPGKSYFQFRRHQASNDQGEYEMLETPSNYYTFSEADSEQQFNNSEQPPP